MLYEYRRLFLKDELSDMLLLFSNEIKNSTNYRGIINYLNELPSLNQPLINFILKDSFKNNIYVLDTSAKLNMIILWASWCGPCRKEIPLLKKIYTEFNDKGLSMVSISLDTKFELWESALYLEKMNWKQLIVDISLMDKLKDNFKSWAIPTTIFTDGKGYEIGRFTGYETIKNNEYSSIIRKYCK
jgi:thiol-disulfide isomerase/thioredoxin